MTIGLGRTEKKTWSITITGGNASYQQAHGLGFTPASNELEVILEDDVGARAIWIDGIDGTNFDLNMSSADLPGEDHNFEVVFRREL